MTCAARIRCTSASCSPAGSPARSAPRSAGAKRAAWAVSASSAGSEGTAAGVAGIDGPPPQAASNVESVVAMMGLCRRYLVACVD